MEDADVAVDCLESFLKDSNWNREWYNHHDAKDCLFGPWCHHAERTEIAGQIRFRYIPDNATTGVFKMHFKIQRHGFLYVRQYPTSAAISTTTC